MSERLSLLLSSPYVKRLGVVFDEHGDELTGILPYKETLVGNPLIPALHGGAIGAFMEITASAGLWRVSSTSRLNETPSTRGSFLLISLPSSLDLPCRSAAVRTKTRPATTPRASVAGASCRRLAIRPHSTAGAEAPATRPLRGRRRLSRTLPPRGLRTLR